MWQKYRAQWTGFYGEGQTRTSWQKKKKNYAIMYEDRKLKNFIAVLPAQLSVMEVLRLSMFLLHSDVFFKTNTMSISGKSMDRQKGKGLQAVEIDAMRFLIPFLTVRWCPCLMIRTRQKKWALTWQQVAVTMQWTVALWHSFSQSWLKD